MKILVISGKAGSGKDFLAEHIKQVYEKVYGWKVASIAFADPLKMVARGVYGWNGEKGENGRNLLQTLGTDIVHENNQLCWTNCIINILHGLRTEFDLFIIPDARFSHEIDHLKDELPDADIITIRVEGKTSLKDDRAFHPSETSLDDYRFDYYFPNKDYNISIFFYNLISLIKALMKEDCE